MDPPFQLSKSDEFCLPSAYRNFDHRPSLLHGPDDLTLPKSNREALTCRLKQRFMKDADLFKSARKDSFLILGDLYRLIASNWVVVNEYVNRELATIEYILEKEEPGFRDLEIFLKHLHIYRRRCVKYHELITEAKEQCHKRGQQSWSTDTTSRLSAEFANDTEGDFTYLQEKTQGTAQRIEKNINLLASLVAISAGKQGMEDGRGISRFKLLAFVLLPFSIIAAILGMQGELSIGGKDFWLFWAVVLSPIGSVFAVLTLDDGIGSRLFPALTKRLGFAKRKKFAVDEM
jgi:Mg2+ and Co2+ transporter CorA